MKRDSRRPQTKAANVAAPVREPLTAERIYRTALTLCDREGLEAVSMRRLGQELGVEAMSLYNHVPNKAALLDGIYEVILAEIPPSRSQDCLRALAELARALRAALVAHPRAIRIIATRPAVTPAALQHLDGVLGLLREAGLPAPQCLYTLHSLLAFVTGHTLWQLGSLDSNDGESRPNYPEYHKLAATDFPHIVAITTALRTRPPKLGPDTEFEFGLDLLLRGLAEKVAERGASRR